MHEKIKIDPDYEQDDENTKFIEKLLSLLKIHKFKWKKNLHINLKITHNILLFKNIKHSKIILYAELIKLKTL